MLNLGKQVFSLPCCLWLERPRFFSVEFNLGRTIVGAAKTSCLGRDSHCGFIKTIAGIFVHPSSFKRRTSVELNSFIDICCLMPEMCPVECQTSGVGASSVSANWYAAYFIFQWFMGIMTTNFWILYLVFFAFLKSQKNVYFAQKKSI